MRVAVYGGSFNPPHVGHLLVASWLSWTDRVDEVWFLVSFAHPFAKDLAPFDVRARLCERVALEVGARVCRVESELPVPSYTVDVLAALAARHPEHALSFVLGADVLSEVDRWKDFAVIRSDFDPIVVGRQGYAGPPGAIDFPGVSSTEIRRRVRAGESVAHLVPACILADVEATYAADPPVGSTGETVTGGDRGS